jgi:glycosyltransferase involved in cell wall biosynthesis
MVVLRAHNVEYVIWQRMAAATGNPLKRWYLDFLSRRLMKYERTVFDRLDVLVALTGEDKSTFGKLGCRIPVFVSPIGIDTKHYPAGSGKSRVNAIAHLGSMDWMPNLEGVDWFMKNVYPLLLASGTGFTVHLAGKGMPERLLRMAGGNLEVMGKIEDVNAFFADKQIMIVPLLSGGGMRVKIIEGMAMGKTIISTTIGAEGIRCTHGEHILIADSPEEFADAILRCLRNADLCMRIGKVARELAECEYENSVLGARLMEFYSGKMSTGGRKSHTGSAMVNKS